MTRDCGKPYELTVIALEDESGVVDVLDQGACGRNTSVLRAPMLTGGDRVDLLIGRINMDEVETSPELSAL